MADARLARQDAEVVVSMSGTDLESRLARQDVEVIMIMTATDIAARLARQSIEVIWTAEEGVYYTRSKAGFM